MNRFKIVIHLLCVWGSKSFPLNTSFGVPIFHWLDLTWRIRSVNHFRLRFTPVSFSVCQYFLPKIHTLLRASVFKATDLLFMTEIFFCHIQHYRVWFSESFRSQPGFASFFFSVVWVRGWVKTKISSCIIIQWFIVSQYVCHAQDSHLI